MGTIFFISDTHFFHANFLKFTDDSEKIIRPFDSVEAMNEHMISKWNSVVREGDKVYHLGDVTFEYGDEFATLMSRLRGSKRLILGNHDLIKKTNLAEFFKKISLWRIFKDEGFVCSHVPIHQDYFRKVKVNVHGHLHQNVVNDPRYVNVCVEHLNYTPISIEDLRARIALQT